MYVDIAYCTTPLKSKEKYHIVYTNSDGKFGVPTAAGLAVSQ